MSYKNLIDKSLNKAFSSIKDLAKEAVLTKKPNPSFNFENGVTVNSTAETINTKIVITNTIKRSQDRNTSEKQLMLKTIEVGDLNNYSTIQFDSTVWNLGSIQKNDGYISIVNVYKET